MDDAEVAESIKTAESEIKSLIFFWGMRDADPAVVLPIAIVRLMLCFRDILGSDEGFHKGVEILKQGALEAFKEMEKGNSYVH